MNNQKKGVSRRDFLKIGSVGVAGLAGVAGLRAVAPATPTSAENRQTHGGDEHAAMTVGQVDHERNGFYPLELLYDFDYGTPGEEAGRAVREWNIVATDREIEIAPGLFFPGWVYGSPTSAASLRAGRIIGQVPGPTLRCVEGERLRVHFTNAGTHPHTLHFHGIHSAQMDGVPGVGRGMIDPGGTFTYEFEARPFGCHLYHCHAIPLKRHIHKGLYGAFIVDPDPERQEGAAQETARSRNHRYPENEAVNEMVIVMNAFDTNFDGENEVYAANTIAFGYVNEPIQVRRDQLQRLYLINMTEFDPINSLHIHGNFFDYYDHGTTLEPTLRTVDTVMQCQAQRGIVEFSFGGFEPGLYMFHAHQSEFAELGWMSFFEVID
ncbi:MAG: multicopper oxidase domain-containing protein [Anaerolineae bacterium]|nr:multicopper oxidase domain-containing protein [Anaerolineae bacterium]